MSRDTRHGIRDTRRDTPRVAASVPLQLVSLVACGVSLGMSGCVRRSLTIRTDPPGAKVYVNDELKGESPVTYDFMWYGWHRVMIRKEGYSRVDDRKQLRSPARLWIPFDLVMELVPVRVWDRREWAYTLTPAPELPAPVPPPLSGSEPSPTPVAEPQAAPPEESGSPAAGETLDAPR